jgi:hypothetical protein
MFIEILGEIKCWHDFTTLDFHCAHKILLAVRSKDSSFSSSAYFKPASNDLVHAMPWQCMFCSLHVSTMISMT